MDFSSVDLLTARLATELQLEDITHSLHCLSKSKDTSEENECVGLQLIQQDLVQHLATLDDQLYVLNTLEAEYHELMASEKPQDPKQQIGTGMQSAMQLAEASVSGSDVELHSRHKAQSSGVNHSDNEDQWEMAKFLYESASNHNTLDPTSKENSVKPVLAERASLHGVRTIAVNEASELIRESADLTNCNACLDLVSTKDTLHLQCTHTYCRTCLLDLFTSAISNPTLFPPRCCRQPVPLETCRVMLPKELIKDFDLKIEELATPNPTYCANADCSKFIRPKDIVSDIGSCVFCKDKTCTQCKNKSHYGLCPEDPHVQLLMDVAKRSKWQQCLNCNNMVELEQGCFHMTCRCKHEFCYLCGVQWKRCTCPQWDENYLTLPLQGVLPAVAPVAAPPAAMPAPHVHSWSQRIPGTCQHCGASYLPWIMRCDGCHHRSCWRCIHNRE